MFNFEDIPRPRLIGGTLLLLAGLVANEWLLTALFSSDGQLEVGSRLAIWVLDFGLLALGLLVLFASRSLMLSLALFIGVGLVSVFVVDLVARLAFSEALYYGPERMYKNRRPDMPTHTLFDPGVHWAGETYGDLAAMTVVDSLREPRRVIFETDAYGYRNQVGASDSLLDLILLGDSFGSGAGTSQEKTWARLWQKNHGLTNYCLSMPGFSPWHQLILLKGELPRLTFDSSTTILWALFCGNDLDEPFLPYLDPREPKGFFERQAISLRSWYRRSPLVQLTDRTMAALESESPTEGAIIRTLPNGRCLLFHAPYVTAQARSLKEIRSHPNLPHLAEVMGEMKRYTDSVGIKVSVVLIPTKGMVYDWVLYGGDPWAGVIDTNGYSVVIGELCQKLGLSFLDLQPALIDAARQAYEESEQLLWWRDDSHWNNRGHAVSAVSVANWLVSQSNSSESTPD